MHPSQEIIRKFVVGRLEESAISELSGHLAECEFCREYRDNYRSYIQMINESARIEIPARAMELADRLYAKALSGKFISFRPYSREIDGSLSIAADDIDQFKPDVINLGTFFSEDPELVLRVMRNCSDGIDYLQLIGKNPELTSNVLIQIPELNKEFVTDDHGKAILVGLSEATIIDLKWQVKMPDASFSLKPLIYDPEAVEYAKDFILETDRHDKIKIRFEGKTEGKQININILELDGKSNFGAVRVAVSQKENALVKTVKESETVAFYLNKSDAEIKIRLFF